MKLVTGSVIGILISILVFGRAFSQAAAACEASLRALSSQREI